MTKAKTCIRILRLYNIILFLLFNCVKITRRVKAEAPSLLLSSVYTRPRRDFVPQCIIHRTRTDACTSKDRPVHLAIGMLTLDGWNRLFDLEGVVASKT